MDWKRDRGEEGQRSGWCKQLSVLKGSRGLGILHPRRLAPFSTCFFLALPRTHTPLPHPP